MIRSKHIYLILIFLGLTTVFGQPVIGTQPVDTTVLEGDSLAMGIAATGNGTLTFQWQDSTDAGTWQDIVTATTDTLTIDTVKTTDSGRYLRVNVTDLEGSTTSSEVLLSITKKDSVPVVDTDPIDSTVEEGQPASFTVGFASINTTIQWQKDSLGTDVWVDIAGATDTSYAIAAAALVDNASKYRAVLTTNGGMDTSMAATLTVNAAPPFKDWTSSAVLEINTGVGGADLAATDTLLNYPLAIRLDGGLFDFSLVKANGEDLRFAQKDGITALDYEIEAWDVATGTGLIWVKIPQIIGGVLDSIVMYWGNAAATDASNSNAVFDVANGFVSVYHLDSSNADATVSANNGTAGGDASAVNGLLGPGVGLDGNGDNVAIDDSTNLPDSTITVTAWVNLVAHSGWTRVLNHGWLGQGSWLLFANAGGTMLFGVSDAGQKNASGGSFNAGEWNYFSGTYDRTTVTAFLNGTAGATTQAATTALVTSGKMEIGGPVDAFNGIIDEVRISSVIRSNAWIKLDYETQKPGQSTVSNPIFAGCVKDFSLSDSAVAIAEGASSLINGKAICAEAYAWYSVETDTLLPVDMGGTSFTYDAGRITGDTSLTLRFKASYSGVWDSLDVVISLVENIPDPIFTLAGPGTVWDGDIDITISPFVSNLSAILASPAPTINYAWSTSGVSVSRTGITTNTLSLTRAWADGTLKVGVCLDNGGIPTCDTVDVEILRPVGILDLEGPLNPINIQNGWISWNKNANVHIWDLDGVLIFNEVGKAGKKVQLEKSVFHGIQNRRFYVRITDLSEQNINKVLK